MNAEPNTIWDVLTQVSGGDLTMLLTLFGLMVALIIVVIAVIVSKTIYSIHKNRLDDLLKRELVDRGFSAEEIATILAAPAATRHLKSMRQARHAPKESGHVLVE